MRQILRCACGGELHLSAFMRAGAHARQVLDRFEERHRRCEPQGEEEDGPVQVIPGTAGVREDAFEAIGFGSRPRAEAS